MIINRLNFQKWHFLLTIGGLGLECGLFTNIKSESLLGGFGKGEKVGEFRTFEEARLKTYKQLHTEFPEKDIDILDMKDENGKYFLIEIVIGFAKWVFIPEEKH